MRIKSNFYFLIICLVVIACDDKRVFDEYKSVGSAWHKDSIVSFEISDLDPKKKYASFINIRSNNDYPFNNIFLIVKTENEKGNTKVDTLEYQMADAEGNLLGNGYTDIKESKLVYKETMQFSKNSKVKIQQAVRASGKIPGVTQLEGITDIGFRIENKE